MQPESFEGILPLNKPIGVTSFQMVSLLRRATKIRTIGHAGTLDPFATGVLILLIGRPYTKISGTLLNQEKEYLARVHLGRTTDTFDCEGKVVATSSVIPTRTALEEALLSFQGTRLQTPPMFSAKKVKGTPLYRLARQGISIDRAPVPVTLTTTLLSYSYPEIELQIACSKGTYIRAVADDLGKLLGCGAHLSALSRTRSGTFHLSDCCQAEAIGVDTS